MASPAIHHVYLLGSCSTCRKALSWLKQRAVAFEPVDITTSPPSLEVLRQAMEQLGGRSRLFNTSGVSYRTLGAATVKAMDDETALAALAADGKLIKRPFLITSSGRITTGFKPQEWEDLLG